MECKAYTEITNIGILELRNLTFDNDHMEVYLDVCVMSDNLKTVVAKVVEITKAVYTAKYNAWNQEKGLNVKTSWSNEPVILDFTYLRAVLEAGKPVHCSICTRFHDPMDYSMEEECEITVDLAGYANELKKAVREVLTKKFFHM